ncbi:MAG: carboxypeptidase regulatory-like domain-containing protein [Verrucomicrobiota bacterium]
MKRFVVISLLVAARVFGADGTISGAVTINGKNDMKGFKLQEAVIRIQSKDAPAAAEESIGPKKVAANIDQKDKTYVPHVVAIPAGTAVEFHNSDPELHNLHGDCVENPEFNLAQPPEGKPVKRLFAKPEVVKLICNVHPDMLAWIIVCADPHFAMPTTTGAYEITGVPPGNYTVTLWHEKFEEVKKELVVKAGEKTELNFDLDRSATIRRR